MNHALVRVLWEDAWFDEGPLSEPWRESYPMTTVGYVVRRTPTVLSVAGELAADGQFRAVTHIPRVLIRRVTRLEP